MGPDPKALPGVGELHDQAVTLHQEKRDGLLAQQGYRDMQAQLRGASPYAANEAAIVEEIAGL